MTNSTATQRKVWAAVLLLDLAPIGFVLGAWLAGQLMVPDDAGLAGGAMVFWYGVMGMVVLVAAGVLLVHQLDDSHLKLAALVTTGLATGAFVLIIWLVTGQQQLLIGQNGNAAFLNLH